MDALNTHDNDTLKEVKSNYKQREFEVLYLSTKIIEVLYFERPFPSFWKILKDFHVKEFGIDLYFSGVANQKTVTYNCSLINTN